MVRFLSVFALAAFVSSQSYATQHSEEYFKVKNVVVQEVTEVIPESELQVQPDCSSVSDATAVDMQSLGDIVNIGKIVWEIIQAGKPVTNSRFDTANALPSGVKCWTELQGWSVPQYKTYNVQYKNGFDMTVVDFTYRVMYTTNGNVNGIGQYITNATVIPASLNVAWGFQFNVQANVPAVTNIGTTQSPLAAMQINLHWSVDSTITHDEKTQSYFVTGDGAFQTLN